MFEKYHVLIRGFSDVSLPDVVVLDHLLQTPVQDFGAKPLSSLTLQVLFRLQETPAKAQVILFFWMKSEHHVRFGRLF